MRILHELFTGTSASEACAAGRTRKRNYVTDVGETGDVSERALEAETESGVRHGPVPPQVAIPAIRLRVQPRLRHALIEHVEPLLTLAAADDLADRGHQHVHGGHGLAVVVHAHVERLDVLRIVHD